MLFVENGRTSSEEHLQGEDYEATRAGHEDHRGVVAGLSVRVGGPGTVAHAGIVLPRLLADRTGLTKGLAAVVARAGFVPLRDRGRALTDATAALAAGATCLSDIEAMTAQVEIFGSTGGASDSTVLRVLNELAARLNADGLPGRRLARVTAAARATAWKWIVDRHGQLPAVKVAGIDLTRPRVDSGGVDGDGGGVDGGPDRPVLVVRLDATLIGADSDKDRAAGNHKGGYGFHPVRREALLSRAEVRDRAPRGAVSSCVGDRPAPLLRRSGVVEAGGSLVR